MLEDFLFSGEGLGYYTFGSRLFGGHQVYEIKMEGLGESSFIRLSGETGVLATMILVSAYLMLVIRGFRISKLRAGTSIASGALFFSVWIISLVLWSNTADVFANSIVTTFGFALSGATLVGVHSNDREEVAQEERTKDSFSCHPI
jgi:O-antigen ligase